MAADSLTTASPAPGSGAAGSGGAPAKRALRARRRGRLRLSLRRRRGVRNLEWAWAGFDGDYRDRESTRHFAGGAFQRFANVGFQALAE